MTFAAGARARDLPGLDVRTSSARRAVSGRTTATASYDAGRPLPARLASSLAGVSSIAVAGATNGTARLGPAYELHTLTLDATTAKGRALPGADVFVMNTDDGRLFGAFGAIIDGQWKVSVPTGNYVILSDDFRHVVVKCASVTGDTTASFSMADATVRPKLTLPDHKTLSPSLDVIASDELGRSSLDFGFGGFLPRISPLASLASGTLHTEVANLWTVKGYREFTFDGHHATIHPIEQVAAAKETVQGIPRHLTFHYRPTDFAKVAIKHYATGPKTQALDGWIGFSPIDFFGFTELFPSVRPGVIHGMLLARKNLAWHSTTTVNQGFRSFAQLAQQSTYRRGQHAQVRFFRGPVTPVADSGDESARAGRGCALCVTNGVLHGFLSMMTSAGTQQFGIDDHGAWALYGRRTRLQRGGLAVTPFVRGVTPGQKLTLVAETTPVSKKYQLSSHVSDVWSFAVPGSDAPIPLLRADYVPPTNLSSHGPRGHVSFPITFDNLGPLDTRVASASVQWSTDDRTWHAASLSRKDGNTFRVSYVNPAATRAHPALSLRIKATDRPAARSPSRSSTPTCCPRAARARHPPARRCTASGSTPRSSAVRRAPTSTAAS